MTASILHEQIPQQTAEQLPGLETNDHAPFFEALRYDPQAAPVIFNDMLQLRGRTYVGEKGFLEANALDQNGAELPTPEDYAGDTIQLALFEQNGDRHLIGGVRLLRKGSDDEQLPIEELFGEGAGFIPEGSLEASRFIVEPKRRAENDQLFASLVIIRAVVAEALRSDAPKVCAVVEEGLYKHFVENIGLPFEVLGKPKFIEEYNTENYPIAFDPQKVLSALFEKDREFRLKRDGSYGTRRPLAPFFAAGIREGWEGRVGHDALGYDARPVERNRGFLSQEEIDKLHRSKIAIAGVGGDGGRVATELARLGVGEFVLADPETFELENINRQETSNWETVGANKAFTVAAEILRINPFARIRVYPEGVTEQNIDDFLNGADLVIDETDIGRPHLGVMIGRKARHNDQPVLMALNVGFGAQVTSFIPGGQTFEERLGIPGNLSGADLNSYEVELEKWLAHVPSYIDLDMFAQVARGEISPPSVMPGVDMAAGVAVTEALNHLVRSSEPTETARLRPEPIVSPDTIVIEGMERFIRVVRSGDGSFEESFATATARNEAGEVPKVA